MINQIVKVFEQQEIRIAEKDGELFWIATDVCAALQVSNTSKALERLDSDEKADVTLSEVSSNGVVQDRTYLALNQYGLFSLVLSSRKPIAKPFKRWVTHEVLPSIAATGSYSIAPQSTPAPALPETSLATYADLIVRLGYQDSPILKSVLEQRLAEELGSKALPSGDADRPILLTVRAHQLGIPQKRIGTGSALGKYIKALGFEPLGKSQHGKYAVNSYTPTDALDRAILEYYGDAIAA